MPATNGISAGTPSVSKISVGFRRPSAYARGDIRCGDKAQGTGGPTRSIDLIPAQPPIHAAQGDPLSFQSLFTHLGSLFLLERWKVKSLRSGRSIHRVEDHVENTWQPTRWIGILARELDAKLQDVGPRGSNSDAQDGLLVGQDREISHQSPSGSFARTGETGLWQTHSAAHTSCYPENTREWDHPGGSRNLIQRTWPPSSAARNGSVGKLTWFFQLLDCPSGGPVLAAPTILPGTAVLHSRTLLFREQMSRNHPASPPAERSKSKDKVGAGPPAVCSMGHWARAGRFLGGGSGGRQGPRSAHETER